MASRSPATRKNPLWIALALSFALHFLFICFWPSGTIRQVLPKAESPGLTVQLWSLREQESTAAASANPANAQANASGKPSRKAPPREMPVPPAFSGGPSPASETKEHDHTSPSAAAPPSTDDLMQKAIRDVGKIDRELRQSSPTLMQGSPNSVQSRLEKGIASAARANRTTVVEKTLGDGRRVTKVSGPGGSYCVTSESVGATDGIDRIQEGMHGKVTNCGSLFD
jgi:hypothetical protein